MSKKGKWVKTDANGWCVTDVDMYIDCRCDDNPNKKLYCQGDSEAICPKCGKKYRVIVYVRVQEWKPAEEHEQKG